MGLTCVTDERLKQAELTVREINYCINLRGELQRDKLTQKTFYQKILNNLDTKANDFDQRLNQYIYELYVKCEKIINESKAKTSNSEDGLTEAITISKLLKRN